MNKPVKKPRKPRTELAIVKSPQAIQEFNVNPQSLIMAAIDKNVSIEVMEKLLAMRDKLQSEQAELAFREAMSKFQSECPIIPKRKEVFDKGGKLRYKYAPIEDIVKAVQSLLETCGLSYDIDTEPTDVGITVVLTVSHVLGHKKVTRFNAPIQKDAYMSDPQKWASASTFAKRYAFCNGFGILTGDEDNDAAICDDTSHKQQTKREMPIVENVEINVTEKFNEAIGRMERANNPLELAKIAKEYSGLAYSTEQKDRLHIVYDARKKELTEVSK